MTADDQDFVLLGASDVQDFNHEGVLPLSATDLEAVQTWLAPTEYAALSSEYGKHRTSHLAGTGTWILDTKEYQQWYGSEQGALWIKAVAGAGKSVIAASLISKLATEEDVPVLYFFFRNIVSANQKPQSLIRDYMSQVLEYCPVLQKQLNDLVQNRRALQSVSIDDMWNMLVSALERLPRVYCFVDALDEMDLGNDFFLHHLVNLAQQRPGDIKLLMTSRPIPRVEVILRNQHIVQIALQPQSVDPDISAYVQHRLHDCDMPEQLRSHVHRTMCAKSSGHFLYARLMMDNLLDPSQNLMVSKDNMMMVLEKLPQPMAGMYTQMLFEHSRRSGVPLELQLLLLQWVTRVERPIRLLELSNMIETSQGAFLTSKRTKSVVREACGPLLEILDDETVCPIHHSFTEYLYDQDRHSANPSKPDFPILNYHEAQRALSITCLKYLCSGWHHDWHAEALNAKCTIAGAVDHEQKRQEMKLKYPFLDYAVEHWDKHAVKSGFTDAMLISALDNFLLKDEQLLSAWVEITTPPRDLFAEPGEELYNIWTPLHVAAEKGLGFYVSHLLANGQDINCLDRKDRTPLYLAASNGHVDAVTALLRAKARNDEPDNVGHTPLHRAASCNHHQVVKLLLEAGVSPLTPKTKEYPGLRCGNSPGSIGETPVNYACRSGHVETLRTFIPYLTEDNLYRALCLSIRSAQTKAALTLLQAPGILIDGPNDQPFQPRPFFLACAVRDIEVMRVLLSRRAEMSASPDLSSRFVDHDEIGFCYTDGSNPLHAFARGDRSSRSMESTDHRLRDGIEMLLDAGVDPNELDATGSTALHYIVRQANQWSTPNTRDGVQEGLELLLNRGAEPTVLTKDGSTVLHVAVKLPVATIDTLIDHGVDVNHVRKSDGKTPLMIALQNNDFAYAKHLLYRGADANIVDHEGKTPLLTLAELSEFMLDIEMLQALVLAGADINARNRNGDTIMHIRDFKPKLLTFALENGFDLEAKNRLGHSVLFHHITSSKAFEALVDAGSDIFTRDTQGSTILHGALARGSCSVDSAGANPLVFFAKRGVKPLMVDHLGNTLWHTVAQQATSRAWKDQCAILDMLRDWKIPALTKNTDGKSPLHIACLGHGGGTQENVIKYLIEKMDADVDVADLDMIRPIHLASSWNLGLTSFLLDCNADAALATLEGQTPLMIACRNRKCNTVCMLLNHYKAQKQIHIVNETDIVGRTALHYACRSGRPETVRMLLDAGAETNIKDKQGYTPLRMCADYLAEQSLWDKSNASNTSCIPNNGRIRAVNVALADTSRPFTPPHVLNPIRVRESIRLLIKHGADISSFTSCPIPSYKGHFDNPLMAAIQQNCPAMVSELFNIMGEHFQNQAISEINDKGINTIDEVPKLSDDKVKQYWKRMLQSYVVKTKTFLPILDNMEEIVVENVGDLEQTVRFTRQLLEDDNEPAVKLVSKYGARFIDLDNGGDNPLFQMVNWGFTDLIREVGQDVSMMTVAWTKEMAPLNVNWRLDRLKSVLYVALNRQIPNLEMVKLLVTDHKIDVNEQFVMNSYEGVTLSYTHLIAKPSYWWQTEALEFLLKSGADIEARTSDQKTPLMIALRTYPGIPVGSASLRSVQLLLQYGANPNVIDQRGQTCLNIAVAEPKLIKLLLKHGADPSFGNRPLLFDVIKINDLNTLKIILDTDLDINVLSRPVSQEQPGMWGHPARGEDIVPKAWADIRTVDELIQRAYPLHVAAFVASEGQEQREKAIEMVKLLLEAGADPVKAYEDGSRIIHVLAQYGHVVKPLIESPNFEMEIRDGRGRTVFLAACDAHPGRDPVVVAELPSFLLEHGASPVATDSNGRNAFHCLISAYEWYQPVHIPSGLQAIGSAPVSQPDCHGRTPYHYALASHHFELIDPFLSYGVDPLIADPLDGTIALHHLACDMVNDTDMILHDRYEMLNVIKEQVLLDRYPFMISLDKPPSQLEADDLLLGAEEADRAQLRSPRRHFLSMLERGLSIETRDHEGETPLFKVMNTSFFDYAIPNREHYILFKLFEDAGANFKARNKIGQSLLHKLATRVFPKNRFGERTDEGAEEALSKAFQWLVRKGLDVSWEDELGRTCLDVAAAVGAQWVLDMYKRK